MNSFIHIRYHIKNSIGLGNLCRNIKTDGIRNFSASDGSSNHQSKRNEKINFPTMRVVYVDKATGKNQWKIMSRQEAIKFAKSEELDLILVNETTDPPVCKLDDFTKMLKTLKVKKKESKEKQKCLKELYFTAGISLHDLKVKIDKAKAFLADGHSVKMSITMKPSAYKLEPTAIDQTVMVILGMVENEVASVHQATRNTNLRREFTLNPSKSTAVTK